MPALFVAFDNRVRIATLAVLIKIKRSVCPYNIDVESGSNDSRMPEKTKHNLVIVRYSFTLLSTGRNGDVLSTLEAPRFIPNAEAFV